MYVRAAFFEGRVKPGFEQTFTDFVETRLKPLWHKFPGALDVRVFRQVSADEGAPPFEMVLQIRYPSLQAIETALASDIRTTSRAETQILLEMFEGRVFHTVFTT